MLDFLSMDSPHFSPTENRGRPRTRTRTRWGFVEQQTTTVNVAPRSLPQGMTTEQEEAIAGRQQTQQIGPTNLTRTTQTC